MPLYEYRCEEDESTLTLLRSMSNADAPVEDPKGLGREFRRIHSTFQVEATTAPRGGFESTGGGSCGCGHGGCGH